MPLLLAVPADFGHRQTGNADGVDGLNTNRIATSSGRMIDFTSFISGSYAVAP